MMTCHSLDSYGPDTKAIQTHAGEAARMRQTKRRKLGASYIHRLLSGVAFSVSQWGLVSPNPVGRDPSMLFHVSFVQLE